MQATCDHWYQFEYLYTADKTAEKEQSLDDVNKPIYLKGNMHVSPFMQMSKVKIATA